jgi:hypothetical protein
MTHSGADHVTKTNSVHTEGADIVYDYAVYYTRASKPDR